MNQSKLEVITGSWTGSWRKARENAASNVAIGFGFTSDWMKTIDANFLSQSCSVANAKPMLLFDTQMKTALKAVITKQQGLRLHRKAEFLFSLVNKLFT